MDVKQLTAEQARTILDHVLKNTYDPKDYFHVKEFFLPNEEFFPDNDEYFLKMALNKLKQDGYVDYLIKNDLGVWVYMPENGQAGEGVQIRRNFKGHIFLAEGGYFQEEERKIAKANLETAYNARMETYSLRLANWTENLANRTRELRDWTKAVGVGAIGLVLWEVILYFLEH